MLRRKKRKKRDALAAAKVLLCGIREASDAFPPLKSATAALLIVWEMSQVSISYGIMHIDLIALPNTDNEVQRESVQTYCKSSD